MNEELEKLKRRVEALERAVSVEPNPTYGPVPDPVPSAEYLILLEQHREKLIQDMIAYLHRAKLVSCEENER